MTNDILLDKMFSSKIDIINHFDDLINRIDIDIDSSLEKYTMTNNFLARYYKVLRIIER